MKHTNQSSEIFKKEHLFTYFQLHWKDDKKNKIGRELPI